MKLLSMSLCALVLSAASYSAHAADGKMVHVVCFKYKEGVTAEQIKKMEADFRALKEKIPQIASYTGGAAIATGKDKGFNHCSVLTFKDKADLDTYVKNADHQAFAKSLGDIVADAFVIDYMEP
jgi:hypothetical protein